MWHPGHHHQQHGNFTAGASGVSKTAVCWGFQHSRTLWGQQGSSDTFFKKNFYWKRKRKRKIPKGELPPSTGVGMAKAEGLQPQHGHTSLEVTERTHSCFSG